MDMNFSNWIHVNYSTECKLGSTTTPISCLRWDKGLCHCQKFIIH